MPGWVCVSEYWADELFVDSGDVLLGVAIRGGGESSEDVQASFCFCVNALDMLPERHSSVIGHSKEGWCWVVRNWAIVEGDYWLGGVFLVPGCEKGESGLGRGDLESIGFEPLFESVYVLLKVCGGGLVFGVLCYDCDVVGVRHDLCVGL